MPLYKSIEPNSQTIVKIWKINESFEQLSKVSLRSESKKRVDKMKSDIHRRGFLSIRHLLKSFGYTDHDLYYDDYGKPHLKDGKHISITHSYIFSAVIISDNVVGIDIEKQREKIALIAHKFCEYELQFVDEMDSNYIKYLTLIWCAKESLYKLFAQPGLSFKEHTLMIPCLLNDETTSAWILYEDYKLKFDIQFLEFEGFSCAYALPK